MTTLQAPDCRRYEQIRAAEKRGDCREALRLKTAQLLGKGS